MRTPRREFTYPIYLHQRLASEQTRCALAAVARAYQDGQLVVIYGAGVSAASGLPLAHPITVENLFRQFPDLPRNTQRDNEFKAIFGQPARFDPYFNELITRLGLPVVQTHVLVDFFKGSFPNESHFAALLLAKAKAQWSLNIDNLFEEAKDSLARELMRRTRFQLPRAVHGNLRDPDTIRLGTLKLGQAAFTDTDMDACHGAHFLALGTSLQDKDVQELIVRGEPYELTIVDPFVDPVELSDDRESGGTSIADRYSATDSFAKLLAKASVVHMKPDEFLAELLWTIDLVQPETVTFPYHLLYADWGTIHFRSYKHVRTVKETLKGQENWLSDVISVDPAAVVLGCSSDQDNAREWKGGKATIFFHWDAERRAWLDRWRPVVSEIRLIPAAPRGKFLHADEGVSKPAVVEWSGRCGASRSLKLHFTVETPYGTKAVLGTHPDSPVGQPCRWIRVVPPKPIEIDPKGPWLLKLRLPKGSMMDFSRAAIKLISRAG